ncbi:ABC transporter ATP-binding protein [Propylenella binzhouense]|uniref:ABC transporter ATP-binding protein n=1 Tax=Propylenella binzhouense TaxID=2555902 RepID=A0A964T3V6_9HYPH|nr:ABC transporter ATP-binding protein [Propylenella binzhouense]MYZ47052.1 ABC transporter ATP-binding protein [Propylenella binzhouense]
MIVLRDVVKTYPVRGGRRVIFDRFSTEFPPYRSIGILGHNGAGKSTLIRLISGIETPDSGEIIRHGSVSWPLGFGGGFAPLMTGAENLRFACRIYDRDIEEVSEFVSWFAELGEYMDLPVRSYSSGMKARLAFGLSMAFEFDYYLIDEVIAVGDKRFRERSLEVFAERRERSAIIMVSHSDDLLRRFCDAGGVVHGGRITFYDTLDEAIEVHKANQG